MTGAFKLFAMLMLLAAANAGSAAGVASANNRARIVLVDEQLANLKPKDRKKYLVGWKKGCANLAKMLQVSGGPYRYGAFAEVSCEKKPLNDARKVRITPPYNWLIEFSEESDATVLTLSYAAPELEGKELKPEGKLSLNFQRKLLSILQKDQTAMTLALTVLDQLPFLRPFDLQKERNGFTVEAPPDFPPPPLEYAIYSMQLAPGLNLWIPRIIGYARRQPLEGEAGYEAPARSEAKGKGSRKAPAAAAVTPALAAKSYNYKTALAAHLVVENDSYWLMDAQGRGQRNMVYEQSFLDTLKSMKIIGFLNNLITGSLSSSYAGFRYGYPLIQGESLVTKSSMVGIFAEVRGGPLAGLRWYWDFAPKVQETIDDQTLSFRWSRASLGWSLDFAAPGFLQGILTRFNIQPKIGIMDIENRDRIYNEITDTYEAATFTSRGSIDLGIELGLEHKSRWVLLRAWGASNLSGLIPQKGQSVQVSSQRAGLDSYFDLFSLWPGSKLSLLAFTSYERIALRKDADEVLKNAADGDAGIGEVYFNLFFLGLGATITW